jgi:hypothetical protein
MEKILAIHKCEKCGTEIRGNSFKWHLMHCTGIIVERKSDRCESPDTELKRRHLKEETDAEETLYKRIEDEFFVTLYAAPPITAQDVVDAFKRYDEWITRRG